MHLPLGANMRMSSITLQGVQHQGLQITDNQAANAITDARSNLSQSLVDPNPPPDSPLERFRVQAHSVIEQYSNAPGRFAMKFATPEP